MSDKTEDRGLAHTVHVPREHQAAPSETHADKAVRLAAEEIYEGKWQPEADQLQQLDDMPIALGAGTGKEAQRIAESATFSDFQQTRESLILGNHPRVIEALARLEQEKSTARTSQEYVEKTAMLHELTERSKMAQHWEGQTRWQGEENEEMRHGLILTPMQFYERLMRVIGHGTDLTLKDYQVDGRTVSTVGNGRVLIGRFGVKMHPEDRSARVPLLVLMRKKVEIIIPGRKGRDDEPVQVATLQWPFGTEWMVMRFDEFGVPTTPKFLGWRTALLSMIRLGIITEKAAHQAFPLGTGPASTWYRQQLYEWGNRRKPN